jgi:hypothetical protein
MDVATTVLLESAALAFAGGLVWMFLVERE